MVGIDLTSYPPDKIPRCGFSGRVSKKLVTARANMRAYDDDMLSCEILRRKRAGDGTNLLDPQGRSLILRRASHYNRRDDLIALDQGDLDKIDSWVSIESKKVVEWIESKKHVKYFPPNKNYEERFGSSIPREPSEFIFLRLLCLNYSELRSNQLERYFKFIAIAIKQNKKKLTIRNNPFSVIIPPIVPIVKLYNQNQILSVEISALILSFLSYNDVLEYYYLFPDKSLSYGLDSSVEKNPFPFLYCSYKLSMIEYYHHLFTADTDERNRLESSLDVSDSERSEEANKLVATGDKLYKYARKNFYPLSCQLGVLISYRKDNILRRLWDAIPDSVRRRMIAEEVKRASNKQVERGNSIRGRYIDRLSAAPTSYYHSHYIREENLERKKHKEKYSCCLKDLCMEAKKHSMGSQNSNKTCKRITP